MTSQQSRQMTQSRTDDDYRLRSLQPFVSFEARFQFAAHASSAFCIAKRLNLG